MKKTWMAGLLALALALTGCSVSTEGLTGDTAKEHYYEILDAEGETLYTVTGSEAVDAIDALFDDAGKQKGWYNSGDIEPLYTYIYWQRATTKAGQSADAEPEYLEVIRVHVPAEGTEVTTEILPETMGEIGATVNVENLESLLSFATQVSQETADALRDPARFADT